MSIALKDIPQQEFPRYLQQWRYRWAKCTAAQRKYLEGDPSR